MDIHKMAELDALRLIERIIAQCYHEGATAEQIDALLLRQNPPINDPDVWRARVEAKKHQRLMGEIELRNLGGRDALRKSLGLPPLTDEQKYEARVAYPFTEAGDAEYFANRHQDDLRYDHLRERWLQVDPATGIWVPDDVEHIVNLAKESIRARQEDALKMQHDEQRSKAQKWTQAGETRSRMANTLAIAQAHPYLADDGKRWDLDPMLLGCLSGVVNLETGEHRKADPSERITMRVNVGYDPDAKCPIWEKTLAAIFKSPDPDESKAVIDFLQRAFGYSITGDCREECCFFAWGEGGNGKGTVMNTVGVLLGDYLDDMPYSTLEKTVRGGGVPNDVAKLAGRRFVTCAEVNEFTLNESRLKALTGRDPMTARFLHKEFFTFIPVCKIWIATNNKPKIVGKDDGIWRRIYLIPFLNKFEKGDGKINTNLKDELKAEYAGILTWLVRGALAWKDAKGLNPPATVVNATEAYRRESDVLTPFIEAYMVVKKDAWVTVGKAWGEYVHYCNEFHIEPFNRMTDKAFQSAMKGRFGYDDSKRNAIFTGVGLRSERQDAPPPGAGGQAEGGQAKVPF